MGEMNYTFVRFDHSGFAIQAEQGFNAQVNTGIHTFGTSPMYGQGQSSYLGYICVEMLNALLPDFEVCEGCMSMDAIALCVPLIL